MVAFRLPPTHAISECGGSRGKIGTLCAWAAMEAARGSSEARLAESLTSRYSEWILEALEDLPIDLNFLISDPYIAGHPIVFASRGFLSMSGFSRDEVVGRNGRIFQGPATDRRSVMEIREAVREERGMQVSLLNYRKDGTAHWILFRLFPVFEKEGFRLVHFVAVEVPISRQRSFCAQSSSVGGGLLLGACRNEVRSHLDLRCSLSVGSNNDSDNRGLEVEERREAGDLEKHKAVAGANEILLKLIHYSKLTGKVVCGKRYLSDPAIIPLPSSLCTSLGRIKQSFVFLSCRTDPNLPDMPIVYASDSFLSLTGYSRNEILGLNCRFLGGPETDSGALELIRQSIREEKACTVHVLNYKKDGTAFQNFLHISPVRNSSGKIAFYVGVQIDEASKEDAHGLCPRMKQLGAVGAVKVAVRSLLSSNVGQSSTRSPSYYIP